MSAGTPRITHREEFLKFRTLDRRRECVVISPLKRSDPGQHTPAWSKARAEWTGKPRPTRQPNAIDALRSAVSAFDPNAPQLGDAPGGQWLGGQPMSDDQEPPEPRAA